MFSCFHLVNFSVTFTNLKKQTEAHPLVVLVNLFVRVLSLRIADTRIRHIAPDLLAEQTLQRIGGMDPTVCVQHILGYVLGVDTVDRVAHVLARGDNQRERHQHHHRDGVVETEHGRVDMYVGDFN
jgi:hypothetical protein